MSTVTVTADMMTLSFASPAIFMFIRKHCARAENMYEKLTIRRYPAPMVIRLLSGVNIRITHSGKTSAAIKNTRLIRSEYLIAIARKRPAFL